jgi:DNA modification methylase
MLEIKDKSLILADCLKVLMGWYEGGRRNFIDVIYIDPPFNSQKNYNIIISGSELSEEAFKDIWSNIGFKDQMEIISKLSPTFYRFLELLEKSSTPKSYITYLCMMGTRCWYMREMLKDTGSFFYHCDPTASHYIKMMLDTIFGIENFRNEIVYKRESTASSWKANANYFSKIHDVIFIYSKTNNYYFDKPIEKWGEDEVEKRFSHNDNGGKGPYQWAGYCYYTETKLQEMLASGEAKPAKDPNKKYKYYYKHYASQSKLGSLIPDIWDDVALSPGSSERRGYPTQKSEALLERIILSFSKPDDLVVDFYLGGGTTTLVAEKLDRKWIGTDINLRALQIAQERLEALNRKVKRDFFMYGIGSSKDIREMIDLNLLGEDKDSRFDLEDLLFKYCFKEPKVVGNKKKRGDNSIDGRFMFDFDGEKLLGIAQATVSGNKAHMKMSCSHFFKEEKASYLVYITWSDKINDKLIEEAKSYGKIGGIDRVSLMTLEEVIDNGKQITLPSDPQRVDVPQPNQIW